MTLNLSAEYLDVTREIPRECSTRDITMVTVTNGDKQVEKLSIYSKAVSISQNDSSDAHRITDYVEWHYIYIDLHFLPKLKDIEI